MNEYVSYEDLDEYQSLDASAAADIALLRNFCTIASRMLDGTTRRVFYPRSEARLYDHPDDDSRLKLDEDLLEVTTFTTNNGDESVAAADYFLMCGPTYNRTPYDRITMKTNGNRPNLLYSGTAQQANSITGIWGYHETWDTAWQSSGDTLSLGVSATGTTFSVSDADGNDIYGLPNRFKVQQLGKVDDEYFYILTVTGDSTNTLTVIRGVNGTTAATHDSGATIYVYRPMVEIEHATKRLAAWLYGQRDAPFQEKIALPGMGEIIIPQSAPVDVLAVASHYKRW